jgi:hypothetical protein
MTFSLKCCPARYGPRGIFAKAKGAEVYTTVGKDTMDMMRDYGEPVDYRLAKVLWFFLSRKNFFFEKKKQKTYIRPLPSARRRCLGLLTPRVRWAM